MTNSLYLMIRCESFAAISMTICNNRHLYSFPKELQREEQLTHKIFAVNKYVLTN